MVTVCHPLQSLVEELLREVLRVRFGGVGSFVGWWVSGPGFREGLAAVVGVQPSNHAVAVGRRGIVEAVR